MIPLPHKLRKNGFWYTQILRKGRSCIYEQMVCEKLRYFEVFEVQIKPKRDVFGKSYSASEVFPGNEDFGKTAWSCRSFDDAMTRFSALLEKQSLNINIKKKKNESK